MRLIALSLAWVVGVYLGSLFSLPLYLVLLLSLAFVGFALSLRRIRGIPWVCLCLVMLLLGTGDFAWRVDPSTIASLNDRGPMTIKGEIIQDTRFHGTTASLSVSAEHALIDGRWESVTGKVLVETEIVPTYNLGDRLELTGEIDSISSISDAAFRTYLSERGYSARMAYPELSYLDTGWLFDLRSRLADSLSTAVPEPQVSVAKALLLGIRTEIPQALAQDFYRSGTTHILAISGFNVAVIGGIVLAVTALLLGRCRPTYLVLTLLVVWVYALLTGMQPPVFRAAIMFSLFIVALSVGRPDSAAASLAFAAAVMVGICPMVLWDVSFQLSCASVAGLVVIFPPLQRWGDRTTDGIRSPFSAPLRYIIDGFAVSFAAIAATLPIVLHHFGTTSILALPATLCASLFLPGAIILILTAAIVGLLSPALAAVFGWSAWLFLSGFTEAIRGFGSLSHAMVETGRWGVGAVCGYYFVLLGFLVRGRLGRLLSEPGKWLKLQVDRLSGLPSERQLRWILAGLGVAASLLWIAALSVPSEDRLEVHFFDVGHGDSILIETPAGQQILIDGGPSPNSACTELGKELPFWDKSLDLVVLTHPHEDHLVGLLEVLRRYKVDHVLESGYVEDSPAYREWSRLIEEKKVDRLVVSPGRQIDLGHDAILQILHPPTDLVSGTEQEANNNSIALRLVWMEVSFLFTGDLCSEGESYIMYHSPSHDLTSTVLKVAHHGSNGSTSAPFLAAVDPRLAVISVGEGNTFGHPGGELLDRLGDVPVYRTDLHGTISLLTDGERLWLEH